MDDFHFLRPLWLLTAFPALFVWWALWRQRDNTVALRHVVDQHLLEHLLVGESGQRGPRPVQLLLLMWMFYTLALAGPAWRMEASPFADDEAGLVVVLKVSGTMLASDVQPSRLTRAKHKLRDLLELRQGSSTGLIVYSGSAHLVIPLTRDDRIVSSMVEDLTPDLMPVEGDALVQALDLAVHMLAKSGVPGSVLVIADNVAPAQSRILTGTEIEVPVQFLSVQSHNAPLDSGLQNAANKLGAPVVELTVDLADVTRLARRAQSSFKSVSGSNESSRWQDAGFRFLPLIALIALMWSRRGWRVR